MGHNNREMYNTEEHTVAGITLKAGSTQQGHCVGHNPLATTDHSTTLKLGGSSEDAGLLLEPLQTAIERYNDDCAEIEQFWACRNFEVTYQLQQGYSLQRTLDILKTAFPKDGAIHFACGVTRMLEVSIWCTLPAESAIPRFLDDARRYVDQALGPLDTNVDVTIEAFTEMNRPPDTMQEYSIPPVARQQSASPPSSLEDSALETDTSSNSSPPESLAPSSTLVDSDDDNPLALHQKPHAAMWRRLM